MTPAGGIVSLWALALVFCKVLCGGQVNGQKKGLDEYFAAMRYAAETYIFAIS